MSQHIELNLSFLKKSRMQINFKLNRKSREYDYLLITHMKKLNSQSLTGSKGSFLL